MTAPETSPSQAPADTNTEQRVAVLAAMGLKPDGTPADPDPAELAAEAEHANAVAWAQVVELAVFRQGVDADALMDSRTFVNSLDQFVDDNPADPAFAERLATHIGAYVEAHPQYKAKPVMALAAAGPAPRPATPPKSAGEALAARFGPVRRRRPAPLTGPPTTAGEAIALAMGAVTIDGPDAA